MNAIVKRCVVVGGLALAATGCGASGSGGISVKTVVHTVTGASSSAPGESATVASGSTTSSTTKAAAGKPPTTYASAAAAGPPVNLTATPAIKAQLVAAAMADQDRENVGVPAAQQLGGISLPAKGDLYYARWGGYEYASGSFDHATGQTETDYVGLLYRPVGGAWHASMQQQGDLECTVPTGLTPAWGASGAGACNELAKEDPHPYTVIGSMDGGFHCFTSTTVGTSRLHCWAYHSVTQYQATDPQDATSQGAVGPTGPATTASSSPERYNSPTDIAGFGIPYSITTGDGSYVCTFLPTSLTCTSPSGGTLRLHREE